MNSSINIIELFFRIFKCPSSCMQCLNQQLCELCVAPNYMLGYQCVSTCTVYYHFALNRSCLLNCPDGYYYLNQGTNNKFCEICKKCVIIGKTKKTLWTNSNHASFSLQVYLIEASKSFALNEVTITAHYQLYTGLFTTFIVIIFYEYFLNTYISWKKSKALNLLSIYWFEILLLLLAIGILHIFLNKKNSAISK